MNKYYDSENSLYKNKNKRKIQITIVMMFKKNMKPNKKAESNILRVKTKQTAFKKCLCCCAIFR